MAFLKYKNAFLCGSCEKKVGFEITYVIKNTYNYL